VRLFAAIFALFASSARAEDIAVALSQDVVEVNAGFSGANIVLFGALIRGDEEGDETSPLDLVAVLRGPRADFRVRPLLKSGMIWTPGPAVAVDNAPSLLVSSATRPLDEIAPPQILDQLKITIDPPAVAALIRLRTERAADYVGRTGALAVGEAFLDAARKNRRYSEIVGAVEFEKNALFKIDLQLPPGTAVGAYFVDVYLFRDGAILAHDAASLTVGKVGIERTVFDFAHDYSIAYGLSCVALSLGLGWLAAAAFRK
jgi:uncharacterized protein (TIGR02186 family)